jgi:hypothetical protein
MNHTQRRFWKRVWHRHEKVFGLTLMNTVQHRNCFRPFVELICADYLAKKHPGARKYFGYVVEELTNNPHIFGTTLLKLYKGSQEAYADEKIPTAWERMLAVFVPEMRDIVWSKVSHSISRRLALAIKVFNVIYTEQPKTMDLQWIPWMDELCHTLDGLKLRQDAQNADSWQAANMLQRSADLGDGASALMMYVSADYANKGKEAFALLDSALECGLPEAYIEYAFLIENGMKTGNLYEMYKTAILKGSRIAAGNAETVLRGWGVPSHRLAAVRRLARVCGSINGAVK